MKKQKRILLLGYILGVIVTAVLFLIPLETAFRSFLACFFSSFLAFFVSLIFALTADTAFFTALVLFAPLTEFFSILFSFLLPVGYVSVFTCLPDAQ